MTLAQKYPKLFSNIEDKELEIRHLLSIDENYEDFDSEEYEFDFEEYNYVIYIAEPIQKVVGKIKMEELMVKLHDNDAFEKFLATDIDIYGVKSTLNKEEISTLVMSLIEDII
ncbi:MAG: hypothetical protein U9O24_03510 [Campylobacterota bacterium]|nr:hypothetical protein [Campylobacterota bacterium]